MYVYVRISVFVEGVPTCSNISCLECLRIFKKIAFLVDTHEEAPHLKDYTKVASFKANCKT